MSSFSCRNFVLELFGGLEYSIEYPSDTFRRLLLEYSIEYLTFNLVHRNIRCKVATWRDVSDHRIVTIFEEITGVVW